MPTTVHTQKSIQYTQVHTNPRWTQCMPAAHRALHTVHTLQRRAASEAHNGGAESKGMSQRPNTIKFLSM